MAIKKMYKHGGSSTSTQKLGKMGKQTTRKKQTGGKRMIPQGVVSPRPAASFIEPATEQPFEQSSFVAQRGGMRKLRKEQREERKEIRKANRTDRKLTRQTAKYVKKGYKKLRKAKPFEDGAGPIVEMTRAEKRSDRKTSRKAGRIFKKQERTKRRDKIKEDRKENKLERRSLRANNAALRFHKKNTQKKEVISKVNKMDTRKDDTKTVSSNTPVKKTTPIVKKPVDNKTNEVKTKQTFSQAYRTNRDAGEKTFMHNGKKYTTESRSEKAARLKKNAPKKESTAVIATKDNTKGILKPAENLSKTTKVVRMPKNYRFHKKKENEEGMVKGFKQGGYKRRGGKR